MKLSLKALLIKSVTLGTLAAAVALVAPAQAHAQGFGVAVQFGNAYGPRYDDRFYADHLRHEDWRRHEEWVRQGEWLRRQEWERTHAFYGRPPYAPAPFGYYGR